MSVKDTITLSHAVRLKNVHITYEVLTITLPKQVGRSPSYQGPPRQQNKHSEGQSHEWSGIPQLLKLNVALYNEGL